MRQIAVKKEDFVVLIFNRFGLRIRSCVAIAGCVLASAASFAQYPNKPIKIIVPFTAGGTTDILARAVGAEIQKALGQAVVIENRAGAGGNIGADAVAKAAPDGYTLLMGTVGTHGINVTLYPKMPYDAVKDFAPVSLVASVPNVLVAAPSFTPANVKELIDAAKKEPNKLTFASSGSGTSIHLSGELFKMLTSTQLTHVPYKGSAAAIPDSDSPNTRRQIESDGGNLVGALARVAYGADDDRSGCCRVRSKLLVWRACTHWHTERHCRQTFADDF
jgi:tripartite-type tricarboxylate transporter receptor subunit TctC